MDVKLALLLREGGELMEALSILKLAVNAAAAARSEANRGLRGCTDECFRHVCASRSHRVQIVADAVSQMPAASQVLAALHHDAVMLLFGVQLDIGIQEQSEQADRLVARSVAALQKRRQQVWIGFALLQ